MRPVATFAIVAALGAIGASPVRHAVARPEAAFEIPESIRIEHDEIRADLAKAVKLGGTVGERAADVQKLLIPHMAREEQIALPELGLLEPLSQRQHITGARAAMALSDTMRYALPHMLDEHETIRKAVLSLGHAAEGAGNIDVASLARRIAVHAQTEEQVLYPAAILVGDLLRQRQQIGE